MVVAERPAKKKRRHRPSEDPVLRYARDVLDGRILASEAVIQAAQRHVDDLRRDDIFFIAERAQFAIDFSRQLKHTKGRWAGDPIVLLPWQEFIAGSLFGWYKPDGSRRFHEAYVSTAKKSGKTTFAAVIGLIMAFFDGEEGSEVYAAATKKDQANIVFFAAKQMVEKSEYLRRRIQVLANNLSSSETNSFFKSLGQDRDNIDGINTHCAICDELHAWPKRALWDTLETSTAARHQSLVFSITTAGYDRKSLCRERYDFGKRVLSGTAVDDAMFVFIAELDKDDDWRDETVYIKANPSLGVTHGLEPMLAARDKAIKIPGEQNSFRRYRLNEWTEQASRWLDLALWDIGGDYFAIKSLAGRKCWAGLDLGRVRDFSALVLVFPAEKEGEKIKVVPYFWIPEQSVTDRLLEGQTDFAVWVEEGWIKTTPGNSTDFRFIEHDILEIAETFELQELAYDRWATGELINNLEEEGLELLPHGQGYASMSGPTDEVERLLLAEELQHAGHPVLRWMAENVVVREDPAGNKKPDKEQSGDKIDGIVGMIMGLSSWYQNPDTEKPSVYEERGALAF